MITVLITLVIIGIIAAITVPSIMNNTNAQEYRSKFKKAILSVNQALTLHYALEGLGAQDYESSADLINYVFKKRMNILAVGSSQTGRQKTRASGSSSFVPGYVIGNTSGFHCEPYASGDDINFFISQDGVIFCIDNWYNGAWSQSMKEYERPCNVFNSKPCTMSSAYPNLWIDVNGIKKPNRATTNSSQPKDQYEAVIYNTKVVPYGVGAEIMYEKK